MTNKIINRINSEMESKNISRAELARQLGVHQSTVKRWLDGTMSIYADRLFEIMEEVGVKIEIKD